MGYRSTVAYTIRFIPKELNNNEIEKAKASFYTFIGEAKSKPETALCFEDEGISFNHDNLQIRFFASDVKWYEDYSDVKCHLSLMNLAKDWCGEGDEEENENPNPYIGGVYVCMGENADDCTEEVFGMGDWDWISAVRYIKCDWMD